MPPQHISTHIIANFHLGLSYHHDRVEEGRDFLRAGEACKSEHFGDAADGMTDA